MIKNLLRTNLFKNLTITAKSMDEIHVESFNRLQCPDISRAPSRARSLCGTSEKQLGSPTLLFPFKNCKKRKLTKNKSDKINGWLQLVKTMSQFGAKGQVAGINNFINSMDKVSEIATYGKFKNWATPVRYFHCEDNSENYAVAKYLSLRLLGFHAERLRLVWLRSKGNKVQHAVLMVQLADMTFVLDSRSNKITTDDMLEKERPICSLNGSRFVVHWDAKTPNGAQKAIARLTKYAHQNDPTAKLPAAA